MAYHYAADYNIFALVRIEDRLCTPNDTKLVKMVSDKIGMEFIATAESDKTLKVIFDLEQMIGKNIIWVTGNTFEQVCFRHKALPNMMMRFCTTEMKMKPIFEYCHDTFGKVTMNIGFRYDEKERADTQNIKFKTIIGKSENGRNKWGQIEWRECAYPLINFKVTNYPVYQWAISTGITFPPDSNCVGCFWKPIQQLRQNWEDEPKKMNWFMNMEKTLKRTWKKEMSYDNVKTIGLQQDFFFGTGSGCQAGFCTD